jgi:PAS domain S-box-containing protein
MVPAAPESREIDADVALRAVAEGTAATTGEAFFRALVQNLARVLDTHGAWVTEYFPERHSLRALAFWMGGQWIDDFEAPIANTPCEQVVLGKTLIHVPDRITDVYRVDPGMVATGVVAYVGVPLLAADDSVMGHLAVIDRRPIRSDPRLLDVFYVFAARAAAEQQRLIALSRLHEREEKLARLIDTAMDAIVDLDADLSITSANAAAARVFRAAAQSLIGRPFTEFLTLPAAKTLLHHADHLATRADGGALWLPEHLDARRADGDRFVAEASLTRYSLRGRACHTVILRDVGDRLEAQRTIQTLSAKAQYLQDELRALNDDADQMLGDSLAMRHVRRDIAQVAATDASVLLLGETGTGKELIARAIHAASPRKDEPLIRVNCAAIPATLIESEFFGHEKGAFTGATQKRDGRFLLADRGTLFLDEVGELPLDLQVKLLRALQEGEFEPVGSARTIKVDVRVIAATNRDLQRAVTTGHFRHDLFYRLNVFPIRIPPLRDRDDDIALLAAAFTQRVARRLGKFIEPPSPAAIERLCAYTWPGNVRELQNVIERAVITSHDGRLNLDRALPETGGHSVTAAPIQPTDIDAPIPIRTASQIEAIERDNLLRALQAARWRIAGPGGAAELLAIPPSTLRSRLKALSIPRQPT